MTRVSSALFWFGMSLVASLGLYGTSNRVQELGKQLRALNVKIEAEQANIHVLKAEWVYLSNPARIEAAARKYLAMHPASVEQIAKIDDLPSILPTPEEAQTGLHATARSATMVRKAPANKTLATAEETARKNDPAPILAQDSTTSGPKRQDVVSQEIVSMPQPAESLPYSDAQFRMAVTDTLSLSGPTP